MLVRDRRKRGDKKAELSDYKGETLGKLSKKVEPLLVLDPAHPGKLQAFRHDTNPAKHDHGVPNKGTLQVALGDLKKLKKDYL